MGLSAAVGSSDDGGGPYVPEDSTSVAGAEKKNKKHGTGGENVKHFQHRDASSRGRGAVSHWSEH